MSEPAVSFQKPTFVERLFNGAIGALLRAGIGLSHMRLLEVQGRKSGKRYSLPVDLLSLDGRLYLVGPRGHTQWSRNAAAAGSVVLRRGGEARKYAVRALADAEKPPVLAAYLDRFRREVQRFFPVPAGSGPDSFTALAPRYPAFELTPRRRQLARNVEIKARLADLEATRARVLALAPSRHEKLTQVDTFFRVSRGRLKLRKLGPDAGELIFYERSDETGPKLSEYAISRCERPDELTAVLGEALGVRGEVAKERDVYHVGRTRIHLDRVRGLGDFLELEVVIGDTETAAQGETVARELLRALAVPDEALVAGAYADLLF